MHAVGSGTIHASSAFASARAVVAMIRSQPLRRSELHQQRGRETRLVLPEVGLPADDGRAGAAAVYARRSDAARTSPIRHVRVTVIHFIAERDVFARHVVEGCRAMPGPVRIA